MGLLIRLLKAYIPLHLIMLLISIFNRAAAASFYIVGFLSMFYLIYRGVGVKTLVKIYSVIAVMMILFFIIPVIMPLILLALLVFWRELKLLLKVV